MATAIDYSLLSLRVYRQDQPNAVRGPIPPGWEALTEQSDNLIGFSAGAYRNTATGEIVIAYTGTNEEIDWVSNVIAAGGLAPAPQVLAALNFYSDVVAQYGSNVTFTGHSLGAGLASLLAVFFDKPATVFDVAPFQLSAVNPIAVGDFYAAYAAYQLAHDRIVEDSFSDYTSSLSALFSLREGNVVGISTQGEALASLRGILPAIIGTEVPAYSVGENSVSGGDLHSMSLLTAVMLSPALRNVLVAMPHAVDVLMEHALYTDGFQTGSVKAGFLAYLIRNQVGVQGSDNPDGNGMLDRFAAELVKLGEYGSTHISRIESDVDMQTALIATIMEYYYFVEAGSSAVTPFIESVTNGIRFDVTDIPVESDRKGQDLLLDNVKNLVTEGSGDLARTWANAARVWSIQAGTGSLTTIGLDDNEVQIGADGLNNHLFGAGGNDLLITGSGDDELNGGAGQDVLLSGSGDDVLDGGANNDTLIGADNNDTLIGGTGKDYLYGGADFDTYQFTAGDGFDTIKGDDNDGQIVINGITLTGANAQRSRTMFHTWYWQEGGQTFLASLIPHWVGSSVFNFDDPDLWVRSITGDVSVEIKHYAAGDLGLLLSSAQQRATPPAPQQLIQEIQDQVEDAQRVPTGGVDPLILDLDGDGVETLNVTAGIHFDHDANGFAETTGWVGADDGLLVRDLNGNDLIDSGVELFGNNVLLSDGSYAEHGFEALAELDSNGDGQLSSTDTAFSELRIWKDANSNGVTDAGELLTLSAAGVQSISTRYANGISTDVNGNQHLQTGTYTTTGGATRQVDDVWFAADWSDTVNTTTMTVSAEVEVLPDVAGFGNVSSLHQAMMLDTSGHLQSLVTAYAAEADVTARTSLLQQIVFAWADVEGMAPNSRGSNVVDARTVYTLEAFLGEPFVMSDGSTTPTANAATQLLAAYNDLAAYINGQLLAQTHLQSFYEGMVLALSADEASIAWDVSGAVAQLQSVYDVDAQAGLELLESLVSSLKTNEESGSAILTALRAAGDLDATGLMRELALAGFDSSILGTGSNDVLNGGATDELVIGLDGDDVLSGNGGDDVLDGGVGSDALTGGDGSDVYVFGYGSGQDVIGNYDLSTGRVDALELGAGITAGDIVLVRSGNDLIVKLADTTDQVTVTNYFLGDTTAGYALNEFRFADGTVWSQSDINSFYLANAGTEEADTLSSFAAGSVLHGRGGNDTLTGGAGTDSLYGDAGNDVISAGAGNDVVEGGTDNDTLNGGAGQNTYRFSVGDGADTITYNYDSNTTKSNVLSFMEGVLPSDIIATRSGDDLVLTVAGTTDSVRVQRFFYGDNPLSNNYSPVQQAVFADGTVWAINDLVAKVFAGTDANDTIVGTINADTINGADGNDAIYGRSGNDIISGGVGTDILYGEDANDTLSGGDGDDALYGGGGDDILLGGDGGDYLSGGGGIDTIDGGAGNDTVEAFVGTYLFGKGDGQDRFFGSSIDFKADVLPSEVLLSRKDFDLVLSIAGTTDSITISQYFYRGVSDTPGQETNGSGQADGSTQVRFSNGQVWELPYTIPAGTANLALPNTGPALVFGNDLNNTINGSDFGDYLDGRKGIDTLVGGAGDDTYVVDMDGSWITNQPFYSFPDSRLNNFQDTVVEATGQGSDTIIAYNVYSAALAENVENLKVYGINYGTMSFNLTQDVRRKFIGNGLDNIIDATWADSVGVGTGYTFSSGGAGGEMVIDGGVGADTMIGGVGYKTRFVVDNVGDVVIAGTGTTTIESYIDYTLAANHNHLSLVGNAAIVGTGNGLNNFIDGSTNSAANLLIGGLGDDTYTVGAGDVIQEATGEGVDTVKSSVGYTLTGNLESLTLTGTASINGFGNALGNVITGNSGVNYLVGAGGNDQLLGGTGNDTYADFSYTTGHDVIGDTGGTADSIQFALNSDVNVEQLQFSHVGNDLLIAMDAQNSMQVQSWYANANNVIEKMSVHYGDRWYYYTSAQMQSRADGVNGGPVAGVLDTQNGRTGEQLSFQIGYNNFYDIESQFSMTYAATLADGSSLPDWLVFDPATRTFSGTPPTEAVGSLSIRVTATDEGGLNAWADLSLNIEAWAIVGTNGDDTLNGDEESNIIYGLQGKDVMNGLEGNDSIFGGEGDDTYYGGSGHDYLDDWDGSGNDTLYAGGGNDELYGGYGDDTYYGEAGDDYLDDWDRDGNDYMDGGTGADEMWAGLGNDTYVVDNVVDLVGEELSQGTDTVRSSIAYTLTDNVENLTLTGSSAISATGNDLDNVITGNSGNNTLTGNAGNDTLNGGSGSDTMLGGTGNDTYVVAQSGDVVTENAGEGADSVQSSITYTLGNNVENLTLTGTNAINGTGNTLDNILTGNSANNTLTGNAGNDTLDGGAGTDTMVGGAGNDVYYVNVSADVTTESASAGIDTVNSSLTRTLASNIELLFLTGTAAINGTGNTLANLLRGNTANNTLAGGSGVDILEGSAGNDTLSDSGGNTLLNGGVGTDTLTGTANNDLLIGGTGNDALTTGTGADLIAFNKGDGQDTVAVSTTKDNTLSIGGGTTYADLLFQKSGNNLVLKVGASDQITFTNYYASSSNRSVNKLQVVLEGSADYIPGGSDTLRDNKIETFDFGGLVAAFDAALVANPSLTSWALSNALLSQYLTGSDTAALGGDFAYQYGRYGNEANVSYTPAIGILGSASFGTAAQTLQALASLQDSSPRLS